MVPSKYFGALAPGYHNSRSAPAAALTTTRDARCDGVVVARARDAMGIIGRAIAACLAASDIMCVCVIEWKERALNAPCVCRVRNGGRASTGVYQSDARDEGARRRVEWARGDGDSVRGRDWSIATPLM